MLHARCVKVTVKLKKKEEKKEEELQLCLQSCLAVEPETRERGTTKIILAQNDGNMVC